VTYRVIQWGTGSIGKTCLRQVIDHPDLELVGLRVYSAGKDGKDAGEIARRPETGVLATREVGQIIATDADVVLHTPRIQAPLSYHDDDLVALLESGKNVITTVGHQYPAAHGQARAARFQRACRAGGSTFFGTGVNPGFIVDRLVTAATGMCVQLDSASVRETVECSQMREPGFVFDVMGMGRPPQALDLQSGPLATLYNDHFLEVLGAFADRVGVRYDRVEPDHRVVTAPADLHVSAGVIPAGTVAATEWRWHGIVDGKRFFTLSINWIMDWNLPGYAEGPRDHWQIEIRGKPGIYLRMGLIEPDEPGVRTMAVQYAVAATVIRAIPEVCAAPPGILSFPVFGAFSRRLDPALAGKPDPALGGKPDPALGGKPDPALAAREVSG